MKVHQARHALAYHRNLNTSIPQVLFHETPRVLILMCGPVCLLEYEVPDKSGN